MNNSGCHLAKQQPEQRQAEFLGGTIVKLGAGAAQETLIERGGIRGRAFDASMQLVVLAHQFS